ncbi:uncharacterized protein LOC122858323 [Aphidius gifuensis]|uniref:uncharacterized protein LOC122858323 n=1 Tax=Aphidius gifuensis TaxID=684658 RepID=UPI001CDD6E76|nr:uncharacterized protein LOC122858323 [Aphidius gifuensis]
MKKSQIETKPSTPDRRDGVRVQNRLQTKTKPAIASTKESQVFGAQLNKRTCISTRISLAQNQSEVPKQNESDNSTVLNMLFDKYVQTTIESLIVEKKADLKEKELLVGVASLARENENNELKLNELKIRKSEIKILDGIQKSLDKQIADITISLNLFDDKTETSLHQILLSLNDLDHLSCNNLNVPHTDEDVEHFQFALQKSIESVEKLAHIIGRKSSAIAVGSDGLGIFINTRDKLIKQLKILDCCLRNLQLKILTKTSHNLVYHQLQ